MSATASCAAALGLRPQLGPIGAQRPVRTVPARTPMPAVLPPPRRRQRAAAAVAQAVAGQQGMSLEEFNKLITSSPAVLIDFYTTW